MNISSLATRDNDHMRSLRIGTSLKTAESASLMKDVRARFEDVGVGDSVRRFRIRDDQW
jgi:hypothetical protein